MPPVMFSVVTKYHKGRHSLFLYNSEIFYAFTQDILRSQLNQDVQKCSRQSLKFIRNPAITVASPVLVTTDTTCPE